MDKNQENKDSYHVRDMLNMSHEPPERYYWMGKPMPRFAAIDPYRMEAILKTLQLADHDQADFLSVIRASYEELDDGDDRKDLRKMRLDAISERRDYNAKARNLIRGWMNRVGDDYPDMPYRIAEAVLRIMLRERSSPEDTPWPDLSKQVHDRVKEEFLRAPKGTPSHTGGEPLINPKPTKAQNPPKQALFAPHDRPVNCREKLRADGKSYPRTCPECGMMPCPWGEIETEKENDMIEGGPAKPIDPELLKDFAVKETGEETEHPEYEGLVMATRIVRSLLDQATQPAAKDALSSALTCIGIRRDSVQPRKSFQGW